MKMVDGVLLIVDAYEEHAPDSFRAKESLEQKLTPIVVINKIDRPGPRPVK